MRAALLLPLLVLIACARPADPDHAPEAAQHRDWSDDSLWQVLQAQDSRDTPALLAYLHNARADVRAQAAMAFASSPDSLAVPALITALTDADPGVRKAVALAIGNAGDSTAWAALSKASDAERDTAVLHVMLEQAFKAQCELKLVKDPEHFFQLLASGNVPTRTRAASLLARMPTEKMAPLEARILDAARREGDPTVRMFLVLALKHYKSDTVKSALMEWAAKDPTTAIRVSALRALGAREDAGLQGFFLDRTNDGMQAVRLTAVEQLERIKDPLDAQPIWEVAQQQGDPFTQLPLYGLVLKHGDADQQLIARKLLEAQAALDNMPYAEAAIVHAQGNDLDANTGRSLYATLISNGRTPVERTAALEALISRVDLQAESQRRSVDTAIHIVSGFFQMSGNDSVLTAALWSNDPGLISAAADRLAQSDLSLLHKVMDEETNRRARQNLKLPRDLEAVLALDRAWNASNGNIGALPIHSSFNHPIDRQRLVALKDGQHYRIKTTKGDIVIALEPMSAPGSCVAFDSLVTTAYYNGKFFHRIVPNFVAQGGCPRGDGYGSMDWTLRTEIGFEGFTKGAVGLASSGRDTESCQFFIMTAAAPHLNGRYTRFAHVVEGQDVADVLAVGDLILAVQKE